MEFACYIRKTGKWIDALLSDKSARKFYSLSKDDLLALPPVFLTASSKDQDVPYLVSQQAAQIIPNSVFHPVLGMTHDFDSDTTNVIGKQIYQRVLQWLDRIR
ncbi:hypothetical protein [Bacillus sp. B15-48]|uniref:hypothetical protein n=1 Tax=Bacillus sp. B15-48 TaxID=1548601 RepID=UPI00193FBF74|nr:hypothetical protein [Bacillus sp. B15-48]MBM4761330.1 hypothetical protein [Bacillus sp. B15-48]